jgi:hypothetical protein
LVDLISDVAQPSGSSNAPSSEALIGLIALVGALLALGKTAIEFLQARIKPSTAPESPANANSGEGIVSVETTEVEIYSRGSWLMMWMGYSMLAAAGAFYGVYSFRYWFSVERSYLFGAVSIFVGVILAMMGLDRVYQLWQGEGYGKPLSDCTASVVVEGGFSTVFVRCKQAMIDLQAIKPRGSKIEVREDYGIIQGGTGPWPNPSGERVTVEVKMKEESNRPIAEGSEHAERTNNAWIITITSASYCPGFRKEERNAARVQYLLNRVI